MIILNILQWILFVVLGFLLGYQLILTVLALMIKREKSFKTAKSRRFAVVVPAYNEEKVISKTLYSLFSLIYPRKLYDLIVIADNCTDNTGSIARNLGATVLVRENPKQQGKGYALRWGFDRILRSDQKYDAIVVFDSNSLIPGNFLEVMNYYLEKGKEVIQSSDLVIPQPGIWSSQMIRIGFLLYNYVKSLGRKALGLQMGLRGNGMCFSVDHLKKHPWEAWSRTKDLDYGLQLLMKGVHIHFAPKACVWAQMPVNAVYAESQRRRWEMGRYEIMRKYARLFFKETFRRRSLKFLDVLIDLPTPHFANMFLLVLVMITLNTFFSTVGIIWVNFLILWSVLAISGFSQLLAGLFVANADKDMYKSLFYVPLYILCEIKVYIKTFFMENDGTWVRTTRDT